MKKVLLVSKIAPLYRKELFIYLLSNNQLEFHLALGRGEPNGIRQIKEISFKYDNVFWGNTIAYRPERTLWQTGVIKALINSEYDAIILEGGLLQIPSWIFGLLARLIGIKVFLWSHGLRGVESKFLIAAKRFMTHLLDANWLVYGEYQRKVMIKCGFKKTKVSVIYNSIGEIDNSCKVVSFGGETIQLLFVGRLVPGKQVGNLIRAVQEANMNGSNIKLKIVGDGSEKLKLVNMVNRDEKFSFEGAIYSKTELGRIFCSCDYLVSYGNVGLNAIHAMSYGLPVVTHDNPIYQNPEFEAIVEKKTGYLFKRNNIKSLVDVLCDLKKPSEKMRMECKQVIQSYYIPRVQGDRIIDAINKSL